MEEIKSDYVSLNREHDKMASLQPVLSYRVSAVEKIPLQSQSWKISGSRSQHLSSEWLDLVEQVLRLDVQIR